jgi:hypothetical protein
LLQPNIKFASLKQQSLFSGDNSDVDPIDYHDVMIRQGSPVKMADPIEDLLSSAEKAGLPRDGAQSLRQMVTE